MIEVWVNGDRHSVPSELTMPKFLAHLGTNPRLVAVEYNGEILHRHLWENTIIQGGDRLEIVTIVGGG
ncbi:sulfur carrier protein ThiS [[Limnothrix rosea] IAM M-220]|uniref:sulfur carrier protein ThiS n=1 Tax=[Limnothrix rosea] IAM M-220 TaxID=454133 RepID=UPI00096101FD|nr:sulfur carrier protein ThiS [[Limnothrix rosea] IAM M-220]OKH11313.1 thiamine biosynthesis protein ThiS [[Limnothrix rosea] IAM M-220]